MVYANTKSLFAGLIVAASLVAGGCACNTKCDSKDACCEPGAACCKEGECKDGTECKDKPADPTPAAQSAAPTPAAPAAAPAQASSAPINKICPIGEHDADGTITVVYQGKVIAMCCVDCKEEFERRSDADKAELYAKAVASK